MTRPSRYALLILMVLLVLSACAAPPAEGEAPAASLTPAKTAAAAFQGETAVTPSAEPQITPLPGETLPPQPTPTPDQRLDPADWRDWPVVPERISPALQALYREGIARGNSPHAFSKVGDCQAIKEVLMGLYDDPMRYRLPEDEQYLAETIENFAGSFNRDGQAVKGGYNAAAVLSPMWADPQVCEPGESPLECEYRVHRPSIALISLEVWWDGRTPERYEQYMRTIIEFYLENGVVPILSTKADNVEGDHSINRITAELAYEYDLPLWNFWLAVQDMPYAGLDPTRPDGFHISYEAWTVRSHTALETLDAVWRMLNQQDVPVPETAETPQITPAASETEEPVSVLFLPAELLSAPEEGADPGKPALILSLAERGETGTQPLGLRLLDPQSGALTELPGGTRALQAVSPEGHFWLVSEGTRLYLQSLDQAGQPLEILLDNRAVPPSAGQTAAWGLDGSIFLLARDSEGETRLDWLPADGSERVSLDTGGQQPAALLGPSAGERVYWLAECAGCEIPPVWSSPLDGGEAAELGAYLRPALSPDGARMAYLVENEDGTETLGLLDLINGADRQLPLPPGALVDGAWSADSRLLALLMAERSDYSGRQFGFRTYILDANTFSLRQVLELDGLNGRVLYAPDGVQLVRASTLIQDSAYRLHLEQLDLRSNTAAAYDESLPPAGEGFLWVQSLAWVQLPASTLSP
ncbi:MAG TPA: hypothetical protein PLV53_06160 [Anaerolineaceae bacterium]|nr:hypothetical protein [Anaerolineaceae bacterium]